MKRKMSDKDYDVLEKQLDHLDSIENESEVNTTDGKEYELILLNDDINAIEYVISVLIDILGIGFEQAEQLATLCHFRGFVTIKTSDDLDLINMLLKELTLYNLSVYVEAIKCKK
jgi:ATP-dependent Clp protease adapter protein ClpS